MKDCCPKCNSTLLTFDNYEDDMDDFDGYFYRSWDITCLACGFEGSVTEAYRHEHTTWMDKDLVLVKEEDV